MTWVVETAFLSKTLLWQLLNVRESFLADLYHFLQKTSRNIATVMAAIPLTSYD